MVGQRIGNYEIVQRLGEGGMATVYLALHPELRRRVAVKVLNLDLARSAEMVQRFFNEARAASAIGHRGIVEVSDLGTLPTGAPYLVMELLEGESLADRMARTGALSLSEAAEIAHQAAGVMAAAHAGGIVHRDLKPENLYLTPDPLLPGRTLIKVLDFGIAKLSQRPVVERGGDLRTRTGAILGTPRYMSPEQCRESRDVDHRADVYSLGVVLYEMLAGEPPFASSSWGELAHMHIGVEPAALDTHVANIPPAVAAVVHRALQKDPAARFQSMTELDSALQAAMAGGAATATATEKTGPTGRAAAPRPQATTPGLGPSSEPGATRRFETPVGTPAARKTTLESAALEIVRRPKSRRVIPWAVSLAAAAVVILAGVLVLRAGSEPPPTAPASATDLPTTTAAPAPQPAAPPPPANPEPPASVPAPQAIVPEAASPATAPTTATAEQPAPPVAQPTPVRRRRKPQVPDKPAKVPKDAPPSSASRPASPPPPREPLKI